jgi:hypothetical protein
MLHYSTLPVLYNDVTVLMSVFKEKQPGCDPTVSEESFVTLCKEFRSYDVCDTLLHNSGSKGKERSLCA